MTKMQSMPTVTIAITALNEAKNIRAWLSSVAGQKEDNFVIQKILVVSDGSTDGTAALARSFNDPRIEVIEHMERKGKSTRLNEVYVRFKSDILVQSDADVAFGHEYVIRDLIQPLREDPRVGMVGGRGLPFPGETFVECAERCAVEAYDRLRPTVRGGNNIFSVSGQLLAYRREFIERVIVPRDTIGNDMYVYFSCLTAGYRYRYVPSALVNFYSSRTMSDYIRQHTRFEAVPARMEEYFPQDMVRHEFGIPKRIYINNAFVQFAKHPILCGFIAVTNLFCATRAARLHHELASPWDVSQSTKGVQ